MSKRKDNVDALYPTIAHAYRHLLKFDDRAPYERREDGNWAVVYFDETLTVRLFPSLELVGKRFNWCIYRSNVFLTPTQLSMKFTGKRLVEIYNHLRRDVAETLEYHGKLAPALTEEHHSKGLEVAKMVWEQFQIIGDKVTMSNQAGSGSVHSDKYQIDLSKLGVFDLEQLTKQARVIATGFIDEERTTYTEDELKSFARQLAFSNKLKTKQDPFRVIKYYCPQLADLGLMSYPTKRHVVGEGD